MRFTAAIDLYIADMRAAGRLNSDRSEVSYRGTLSRHAEDVGNRDPATTNRDDVKRTLLRWAHPNTQRTCRAVLVSFYRWTMEEGYRKDNPAEQTRRPRKRPVQVYRLTQDETVRMLLACRSRRERWAIYLAMCAGLRNQELRGLQGRHFARADVIWVSADIAKGSRERWLPVLPELRPIVAHIREQLEADDYVLPAQRWRDPGANRSQVDKAKHPSSAQALYYLVKRVASRAGIKGNVHPHTLRHAFADHIARGSGLRTAQALLGHATLGTTEAYLSAPALDDLVAAVAGVTFDIERAFPPLVGTSANPVEAPTGIEPVSTALQAAA
jgi:integrase/recombinase XerD